jgi:Bacterial pre-peptidase C-terminal domain
MFRPSSAYCRMLIACCLLPSAFCLLEASAASPSLGGITPRGAQRGTDAVVFFNGARLADVQEILYFTPGFSTVKLEPVNDNQIKATVKIAPDCRLGEHAMRLRTKTGVSELRTFWVGALPVVEEKEPNSDFAAPQKIPLNVTVHGVVDNEDVDYFAVELKKGQRLSAEIEAMRLGEALFDPYIAILDSKRFELASSDDAPLLGQDSMVSIVAPADGTYIVQVRESAYGGNGGCRYRLHVGTFPRPLAVVPAGGKLGEEVEVRFLGDPTGEIRQKIKLPTVFDPKFGIFAQDAGGISPSAIPFRLSEAGNAIETDGNISHPTATKFDLPNAVNGVIAKPGEVDHYRFMAKKGQTFDVHCYARRLGSPLDSVMSIAVLGGSVIASNDDAVGPDSYFRWTAPEDKEYVLTITDHLHKGGPTYFYRVEFTPVTTVANVTIPKVAQYSQERQTIVVPRGNRYATFVSVSRGNFGGEMILGAETLPPGVTLLAEPMLANLDTIPVVFEATAAAAPGAQLTALTARLSDPKQTVATAFSQQADMILGAPGQSIYWKYAINKAAIAVADEVPFKINIIEPKVPLVQNGSLNLRIVAERQASFKGPITVFPLFNIPGVSSATSAVIAENQTETTLVMNAAPNAQVRKWKMAVTATATVGNGPVWVSSQLANLDVAVPFVALTMERAASEQGKNTEIFCKVQQVTPFTGNAKVRILGLPNKVIAPEMEITKDTKELAFKVEVDKTSPAGTHRNIFCQVLLVQNSEPILQNTGGTELRIDVPLPPKANTPPPPPVTTVANKPPEPPAKPPEKRLTRLEKLRLEQEEREKAAKAGTTPPK